MRYQTIVVAAILAFVSRTNAQTPDLLDSVIARATDLTGPTFESCGDLSSESGEDCLLAAYESRRSAIGLVSIVGNQHSAAEARVLRTDGTLTIVSAYSDRAGIEEYRCATPFIAIEYGRRRVRCRENYRPPLGAKILSEPPTWLRPSDEHPTLLVHPDVPASVCGSSNVQIIAQLLIDAKGHVPEIQVLLLPPTCSREKIAKILKRWRYTKPTLNGRSIATVQVITINIEKTAG